MIWPRPFRRTPDPRCPAARAGWRILGLGCLLALGASLVPLEGRKPLSPAARALVQKALEGLDPARPLVDVHVHAVGNGKGTSGIWVNPTLFQWRHPQKKLMTRAYLKAAGVADDEAFDEAYLARLLALARGFGHPVRLHLLAMDWNHHPDGTRDEAHTEFHVPNAWVVKVAAAHPGEVVPVISIHPYRKDAIPELERWAAQGVKFMKWLPNAQGIDPADPRLDAFYTRFRELGMVLLTHAGEEKAVDAKGAQAYGNPLKLRRPLDLGVTVVIAHCASLGTNEDLDNPGRKAANFELFRRLMGEPKYAGRLFGDISAMTQFNRMPGPMTAVLADAALQERLVNGSDYPLPAVNPVIWTREVQWRGLITKAERKALNEIYRANPLLFDFVLKRTLRDPKTGGRLAASVFQLPKAWESQELVRN